MYDHAPEGYACPFCRLVRQGQPEDIERTVFQDSEITAFISRGFWPNNAGHVLIVPNRHYENLYVLPDRLLARIYACARSVALALKAAYACDGVSTRQHNEPAGGQDEWHYHVHAFPRYEGDRLYGTSRQPASREERALCAQKLRPLLQWVPSTSR
jgi:histidine triad (HIT) family protein